MHPVNEVDQRPVARVLGQGPRVEGEGPLVVGPPRAERAEGRAQVLGCEDPCVDLGRVAPRHRHRPVSVPVVAEGLLQDAAWVRSSRAEDGLQGVVLGAAWDDGNHRVKVVERDERCERVRGQEAVYVPAQVHLSHIKN